MTIGYVKYMVSIYEPHSRFARLHSRGVTAAASWQRRWLVCSAANIGLAL